MKTVRETERKYEATGAAALPDWCSVPGVAEVGEPVTTELDATYFDTADHRLLAAGFTLRRRTGGDDAGWHAKVPAGGDSRDELRLPLEDGMPKSLARLFQGVALGNDLVEVARLRTVRTERTLLDAKGTPVAKVADDRVEATVPGAPAEVWREVEVELTGNGGPKLLSAVDRVLADAGFPAASASSKVSRVLGASSRPALPAKPTAGDVVLAYLREQVELVRRQDVGIRRAAPDSVHQTRVACRKIRHTLRTFRPLLDAAAADQLRADLRWYTRKLGPARDAEVLAEELADQVNALPVELVLGRVQAGITAHFARQQATGAAAVERTMSSDRYYRMLTGLDELIGNPPWTAAAHQTGRSALHKPLRRTWRRLRRSVRRAQRLPVGPERDAALHQARKDAKKARYAADAVRPVFGKKVRRWRRHVKRLQDQLGAQHDAVVAMAELRQLAIKEHGRGANAFTFGVLFGNQGRRAAEAERAFADAWSDPPKLPRWLR